MQHKKSETPCEQGKGFQGKSHIDQTGNNCATLGSDFSVWAYQFPTELALCSLPEIPTLPGHGHRQPRAGGADLTEAQFQNARLGFSLGETLFKWYSKAETFDARCAAISDGVQIVLEDCLKDDGTIRGFAAYIASLIDGYAALAQGATSSQETLQ
jgi:hypothetical protein